MKTRSLLIPFLTLALCSTNVSVAQKQGIEFFSGTLKEAIAKAKAEGKYVFFDAYASWCGPCKTMEKEVFTDKNVADYFNKNFISVRIDMEKGEGPALAKKYTSIDGYPSLLFLNSDGMVVKTLLGSRNRKRFLAEAKLVVNRSTVSI